MTGGARIAVVLGSSAAALEELEAARAFLADNELELYVVCVNDAIRFCPVRPYAFATLIAKHAPKRFLDGVDATGVEMFTRKPVPNFPAYIVKPKWHGTSGLYAAQIALEELDFDGVILAGVPIDAAAGTLSHQSEMTNAEKVARYRPEWVRALPEIAGRVRSLSGWTRELLGPPIVEWLHGLKPLSAYRDSDTARAIEGDARDL